MFPFSEPRGAGGGATRLRSHHGPSPAENPLTRRRASTAERRRDEMRKMHGRLECSAVKTIARATNPGLHPHSPRAAFAASRVGSSEEFEELAQLIAHARRKVWSSVGRILALEDEVVLGWALVAVLSRLGPAVSAIWRTSSASIRRASPAAGRTGRGRPHHPNPGRHGRPMPARRVDTAGPPLAPALASQGAGRGA